MTDFGIDRPANNVNELLEYLNSTKNQGDLFRGQTKDYPALVPSIYRNLLVEGTQNDPFPMIVNGAASDPSAQHNKRKWTFARHLFRCFGLGLGNILSQQYGLSSETLDVTGDPAIAAYFASRSYPDYSPVDRGDSVGVIYRIRVQSPNDERPKITPGLPLSSLDWYFEGGVHDGILFEEFLFEDQVGSSRESNRWFGPARSIEVASRDLTLSCEQILEILDHIRESGESSHRMKDNQNSQYMINQIIKSDWHNSRLVRQNGGLIRPRIIFDSDVFPDFQIARKRSDRGRILGVGDIAHVSFDSDDELVPPFAVPGLAIKRRLKRIENLKHRRGVKAFYFRHQKSDSLDRYRAALWPEPDEDDVFGAIWTRLVAHKIVTGEEPHIAIDDPKDGYLDNGYRVDGEFASAAVDRSEIFFRGILQDADGGIRVNPASSLHRKIRLMALIRLGRARVAIPEILDLAAMGTEEYFCSYALYQAHWQLGDRNTAAHYRKRCFEISPSDCRSHFLKAIEHAMAGFKSQALNEIVKAQEKLGLDDFSLRRSDLLNLKEAIERNNIPP